jgi:hypothetical protein
VTSDNDIHAAAERVVAAARHAFLREFTFSVDGEGINAWLEYIPPLFDWFTQRSPERLGYMVESLVQVKSKLSNEVVGEMAQVADDVNDWEGTAADEFADFLYRFDVIRQNQMSLVEELITGLRVEQEILRRSREGAVDLADRIVVALDELQFGETSGWKVAFTVVGAIAAVVSAPLSGGAAIGWAVLSVGAGMAAADTEVSETAGPTTADTLVAMDRAAARLREDMLSTERTLAELLSQDLTIVRNDRHTHLLPDRPDASRDPILSLDDFRLPSILVS